MRPLTAEALQGLPAKIITGILKGLTRRGYLVEEEGMTYLADADPDDVLSPRFDAQGRPEIVRMQWWLLPHWSKEPRVRFTSFSARVEGAASAASFRMPFRRSRCLIPASGWYEWQELPTGNLPWFHPAGRRERELVDHRVSPLPRK